MKAKISLKQICLLAALSLQVVVSGAQPVIKISAGGVHSLFLKADGSLWGMGYGVDGELADTLLPGTQETNLPVQIVASGVTAIAAGRSHSLFLKSDGSLWGMGTDNSGQLGDGTYILGPTFGTGTNPPQLIVASNVTAIAAGEEHSLFIKSDGSLWAMGRDEWGQLGDGGSGMTNLPEQIVASNVIAIAAGPDSYHSLFLMNDGSLWGMGRNDFGQLGIGTYDSTNRPVMIVPSGVTAISAGYGFSLFLKNDGSLWAMGYDLYGELGDGSYSTDTYDGPNLPELIVASNVTAIAAGDSFSLFIKRDGSLWGMGNDGSGELGNGIFFISIFNPETYTSYGITSPKESLSGGVTAVSAGEGFALILKSDGSMCGMGLDNFGQLGDGNNIYMTNLPEQIVAGPPGYNQITSQLLSGGGVRLSFVGIAGRNYALERSVNLAAANWVAQGTNSADTNGTVVFTNTPTASVNNFWRVRSAQ